MADTHIDYREVSEYGRYFLAETARLETIAGATAVGSPDDAEPEELLTDGVPADGTFASGALIDVSMVRRIVEQAVLAVENGLAQTSAKTIGGSSTRGISIRAILLDCGDRVQRFYYYLRSLPACASVDLLACFPSGRLGALGKLRASELLSKMNTILRGFASPGNLGLVNAEVWRQEIASGRDALKQALARKNSDPSPSSASDQVLAPARAHFLRVYHGLAKPAVRALLTHLGRDHEYRRFFLDLQAAERQARCAA